MLDIILQILSVMGIILLVLLCIAIALLLLVLFFPVSYRISGKKDAETLSLSAGADWLFGLLRFRFAYPEPGRLTVKLLLITLFETGISEQEKKAAEKEKSKETKEERTEEHSDTTGQTGAGTAENTENKASAQSPLENRKENQEENKEENSNQGSDRISKKFEKIKFTICSTYDKIKKIWENISYYVSLLQEEETHLLFSHAVKRLGRVFRNILPRKLKANLLFGTGAPDTTGYAFGVYAMFSPVLGPGVIVTPDFERPVLEGDLMATGYITSVVLVWQFLRVVLDRKLWRFIDKLKKGREPEDTSGAGTKEEKDTRRRGADRNKEQKKEKHRKKKHGK